MVLLAACFGCGKKTPADANLSYYDNGFIRHQVLWDSTEIDDSIAISSQEIFYNPIDSGTQDSILIFEWKSRGQKVCTREVIYHIETLRKAFAIDMVQRADSDILHIAPHANYYCNALSVGTTTDLVLQKEVEPDGKPFSLAIPHGQGVAGIILQWRLNEKLNADDDLGEPIIRYYNFPLADLAR
jgi:hypothetical protein